jgi:hypothetical protein
LVQFNANHALALLQFPTYLNPRGLPCYGVTSNTTPSPYGAPNSPPFSVVP